MSAFARVVGGVVAEIVTPPAGVSIGAMFHPEIAAQFVAVPSGVAVAPGWTESGGVFAAPVAAAPSLAQQAMAALAAGVAIVSTGTPAISGTYPADPVTASRVAAVQQFLSVNGRFPGGAGKISLLDVAGAAHVFSASATFTAFATAYGDLVADLIEAANGQATALPAQPVTIA
ncbi:MAG: hypothetical protein KGH75_01020 [Rhodospirillales bacterium]|nr:hypothetical protein [Rhodospirillales bacterium]